MSFAKNVLKYRLTLETTLIEARKRFLPNIQRNGRLSSLEISSSNQRSSRALQRVRLKTHCAGATYHPKPITQEYTNVQNGYC